MDTQSTLTSSKQIIVHLSNQFPNCFTTKGEVKPLKIGIFQDITERLAGDENFSKTKLRLALRLYTANWKYLYSVKVGVNRVDLDGNACEIVTDEQAKHAQEQLKESKAKAKAKIVSTEKMSNDNGDNKIKTLKPRRDTTKNKQNDSVVKHVAKTREIKIQPQKIEINQLQVGNTVKVLVGTKPVPATITNIGKDNVKVKVLSGMELTVTIEYILI